MAEHLTYEQEYEIHLEVEFVDAPVSMEYAGCGSHAIKTTGKINMEMARKMRNYLNSLPGIDGDG